jgi:nicotinate-nucleotide adenylyltransferase
MSTKNLTGLFFGSFNPIHIGHLAIANYFHKFTDLKELWFVVSPQNPLKNKQSLAPDYHRLEMVKTALGDLSTMKASNIEFSLPRPSYTIDTLTYLSEKYPKKKFAVIMGADSLLSIEKWKNYQLILDNYTVFVYPRPGINLQESKYVGKIIISEAPLMEISSSFIRKAIKDKKDIRFFLHEKVYEYIVDCNLYS